MKIPALPQGTYVIRTKTILKGESETATFSGVEVKTPSASTNAVGWLDWLRNGLIVGIFLVVITLFGLLIVFVLRFSDGESISKETVSA